MFQFRIISFGSSEYPSFLDLRHDVLREPLGLFFTHEELQSDQTDILIGGFYKEKIVATAILTKQNASTIKLRQMAVHSDYRTKGVGKLMMKFAEEQTSKLQLKNIELNARETAIQFYLKMGFVAVGNRFLEVGIEHQKMVKTIES